jgi:hypothetical protein
MASQKLGFPVLVAAHDHDPYIEEIEGCWVVKVGSDAKYAGVIDLVWPSADTAGEKPVVTVNMVTCADYQESRELTLLAKHHNRGVMYVCMCICMYVCVCGHVC